MSADHPKLTCIAKGCERYTRRFPSGQFICGHHWKLIPAVMKRRFQKVTRWRNTAERRHDTDRVRSLDATRDRLWRRMVDQLNGQSGTTDVTGLPTHMAASLRDIGLL